MPAVTDPADLARQALADEVRNIAAKAGRGEALTPGERSLLRDAARLEGEAAAPVADRQGRESGDLVKAYATAQGVSLRTAQRHRANRTKEWCEFAASSTGAQPALFSRSDLDGVPEIDMMVAAARAAYTRALDDGSPEFVAMTYKQLQSAVEQRRKVQLSDPEIALRAKTALPRSAVVLCVARAHQAMADAMLEQLVQFAAEVAADPQPAKNRTRALARRDAIFRVLGDRDALLRAMSEEADAGAR